MVTNLANYEFSRSRINWTGGANPCENPGLIFICFRLCLQQVARVATSVSSLSVTWHDIYVICEHVSYFRRDQMRGCFFFLLKTMMPTDPIIFFFMTYLCRLLIGCKNFQILLQCVNITLFDIWVSWNQLLFNYFLVGFGQLLKWLCVLAYLGRRIMLLLYIKMGWFLYLFIYIYMIHDCSKIV